MNFRFFKLSGVVPKREASNYFIKMATWVSGVTTVDDPETEDFDEGEEVLIKNAVIKAYRDNNLKPAIKAYLKTLDDSGITKLTEKIKGIKATLIWCYNGCVTKYDNAQYDGEDKITLSEELGNILKELTNFAKGGMATIIKNAALLYSGLMKIKKADRVTLDVDKFATSIKELTAEYVKVDKQRKKLEDENKGSIKTAKDRYCDLQDGYFSLIESEHAANKTQSGVINPTNKFFKSLANAIAQTKKAKAEQREKKAAEKAAKAAKDSK